MRKYVYKAAAFAIALACLSITMQNDSYAGTINANEAELMGIIRGTFVYEGVSYVGDPSYINEAYYYFLRDDIEVTDSQKASAIKEMFSRIPEGISKGYLVPVGGKPSGAGAETSEASSELETSPETAAGTETGAQSGAEQQTGSEGAAISGEGAQATEKPQDSRPDNAAGNGQTVPIYEEETAMVETKEASEIVSGDTVFYPAWSVKEKETTAAALDFEALPVKKLENYEGVQNLAAESVPSYDYEEEEMQVASEALGQLKAGFFTAVNWMAGILGAGILVSLGICLRMKLFHHKKEKRGKQKHV
ncbi:MAG: hypothetical protein Q4E24_16385 [bacterium]|nr:hypothetical protein [bacterium]